MGRLNGRLLRSSWCSISRSVMSLRVTVSTSSFADVGPPTPGFALTFQGEGEARPTAALGSRHDVRHDGASCPRDGHGGGGISSVVDGLQYLSRMLGSARAISCSTSGRAPARLPNSSSPVALMSSRSSSTRGAPPSCGGGSRETTSRWSSPTQPTSGCHDARSASLPTRRSPLALRSCDASSFREADSCVPTSSSPGTWRSGGRPEPRPVTAAGRPSSPPCSDDRSRAPPFHRRHRTASPCSSSSGERIKSPGRAPTGL